MTNVKPDFSIFDNQKPDEGTAITFDAIDTEKKQLLNKSPSQVGLFRVRTANQCINDAKTQPIPRKLYDDLLLEEEITILFADTGLGKSIFAVQMANEISKTDKVLYIDLELSDKQFQGRYSEEYQSEYVFKENLIRPDFIRPFRVPNGVDYDTYFIDSLKELVISTGARIVIIDNMTKLVSSDTDNARTAKPLMDKLQDLKFEYNLTLLLLEHNRKTDESRPISLNDLQGSKHKANFADAVFSIGKSAKDKNLRYIKQLKVRSGDVVYDSEHVPIYEKVKENSFLHLKHIGFDTELNHLKQQSENDKAELEANIKRLKTEGKSYREIADELHTSKSTVERILKK
ncbi:MAG: AAA family ATPase [Bacteroidales bacterium]|nr:AAA family ATPase [Bacteroidales bacterium]